MFQWIEKHIEGLLVAAFGLFLAVGFVAWTQEHDARILAEQTVKTSQIQIDSLQKQKAAVDTVAQSQIAVLKKQAAAVKTPAQAIPEIPKLSDIPLNVRTVPGLPDAVTVDALPLFKELSECKQDAVALAACSAKLDLDQKIDADKDTQITALKQKSKRGFWARLKKDVIDTAVTVGIGVAAGYALHR